MLHASLRRLVARVLIVASVCSGPLFPWRAAHASSSLVIGEVAWAGSSLSTSDEWVEIWNLGEEPVVLSDYTLEGASTNPLIFPENSLIAPRTAYLISNYAASDTKSVLMNEPNLVTTAVSLSNSSFGMVLRDATGIELDRTGTGSAPTAGSSGTIKTSMIRNGLEWTSATTSQGFDAGHTELGTPGVCDGCGTTMTEEIIPPEQPVEPEIPVVVEEPAVPTSTEQIPETETTTSTPSEPIPTEETTTSTVEIPLIPVSETATSTTPTQTSTTTTETSTTTATSTPRYDLLRLNEVMAAPSDGLEWIEITSIEPGISIVLAGIQLHDATGKIFTFTTGTVDNLTPFVRATLSSSRLNNSGDTVTLWDPNNVMRDGFSYPDSETGESWARGTDGEWTWTLTPTPGGTNSISQPSETTDEEAEETSPVQTSAVATTIVSPSSTTTTKSSTPTSSPAPKKTTTAPKTVAKTTPVSSTKKVTVEKPATVKTAAPKTTAATKKTTTTKKAAAAKPLPSLITFDMVHNESNAGIPVVLQGEVGTPPGLLSGHYFILLAPDGRGLRVRLPTSRKLPDFGARLRVTGVITFDETGIPTLGVRKDDPMEVVTDLKMTKPQPRLVDLITPAVEDTWSLVHVTGTVLSVKGTKVTLDLQDTEIEVVIKAITGYRASRIKVGDTVTVRGVLGETGDVYQILPRTADEIMITANAPALAATAAKTTLPGWTPFGAAGLAIAGTEGVKQLRARRKQRKLEKVLASGLTPA